MWSPLTAACGLTTGCLSLLVLRMGVAIGEDGRMPASQTPLMLAPLVTLSLRWAIGATSPLAAAGGLFFLGASRRFLPELVARRVAVAR